MIITIDGPTASGKSTIANQLAQALGYDYLSTGYLYRALSYILIHKFHYDRSQLHAPKIEDVQNILSSPTFMYRYKKNGKVTVEYDGEDITSYLKSATVDDWSSLVSVCEMVRKKMVAYQRSYAEKHNTIVEGRDIGTVVFPEAEYKFFLTASLEERAKRWQSAQKKQGKEYTLKESKERIALRDSRDENRKHSPLKIPENAIIIDSSHLTIDQTLAKILDEIQKINNKS